MNRKEIENKVILLALTGSHSYGMATEESDMDYKGIFVAPKTKYYGLYNIEQKDSGWSEPGNGKFEFLDNNKDTVIYEIKKYIKLAAKCNPNILELLFEDPIFYKFVTPIGKKLIANRRLFLSKKVKYTYSGYAFAQIKKLKTHRKWLLNPIIIKPQIKDYVENDNILLDKRELNAFLEYLFLLMRNNIEFFEEEKEFYELLTHRIDYKGLLKNKLMPNEVKEYVQELTSASDNFMGRLTQTQQYYKDLKEYHNYQSWLKQRNPKRAELERKCGYDGKHAAHCLRLLNMGNEILLTGELNVNRERIDAFLLKDIRFGKLSYEEITKLTDEKFDQLEKSYELSSLPHKVDDKKIDNLLIEIVDQYHNM